jgi:hypothetical protein
MHITHDFMDGAACGADHDRGPGHDPGRRAALRDGASCVGDAAWLYSNASGGTYLSIAASALIDIPNCSTPSASCGSRPPRPPT